MNFPLSVGSKELQAARVIDGHDAKYPLGVMVVTGVHTSIHHRTCCRIQDAIPVQENDTGTSHPAIGVRFCQNLRRVTGGVVTKSEPVIQRDEFWQVMFQLADIRWTVGQLHTVLSQGRKPDFIDPALKALWGLPHQQDSSNPVGTHLPLNGKSCFLPV